MARDTFSCIDGAEFVDVYWSVVVQRPDHATSAAAPLLPATYQNLGNVIRNLHHPFPWLTEDSFTDFWRRIPPQVSAVGPWQQYFSSEGAPLPGVGGKPLERPVDPPSVTFEKRGWHIGNPKNLSDDVLAIVRPKTEPPRVSFGLWADLKYEFAQAASARQDALAWMSAWLPEVNVVRRYAPADVSALANAIPAFANAMQQAQIWFVRNEREHFTYRREDGQVHRERRPITWRLKCVNPNLTGNWIDAFAPVYGTIYGQDARARGPFVRAITTRMGADPPLESIGATIEEAADESHAIDVSISRYAAYFFEGFFPLVAHPQTGILIDYAGSNDAGYLISYARLADDPVFSRCLCGLNYPRGDALSGVPQLRSASGEWLRTQYQGTVRGASIPWLTLSSPFFYFTDDHAAFTDPARCAEAEDRARLAAHEEWRQNVLGRVLLGDD